MWVYIPNYPTTLATRDPPTPHQQLDINLEEFDYDISTSPYFEAFLYPCKLTRKQMVGLGSPKDIGIIVPRAFYGDAHLGGDDDNCVVFYNFCMF